MSFGGLEHLISSSPATYGLVFGLVALDAVFPLIPAELTLVTATLLARHGDLSLPLLYAAALAGAILGDNTSFLLGDKIGEPAARRLFRGETGRRRLAWARREIRERGRRLIIAVRFVPGGRTATTFACGALDLPWRRFIVPEIVAAALSVAEVMILAYAAGQAFEHSIWKSLLLSFAIGFSILGIAEGIARVRTS